MPKNLIDWSASNNLFFSSAVDTSDVDMFSAREWTLSRDDALVDVVADASGEDRMALLLLLFRRELSKLMCAELLVDFLIRCVDGACDLGSISSCGVWVDFMDKLFIRSLLSGLESPFWLDDFVIKDVSELMSIRFEIGRAGDVKFDEEFVWLTLILKIRIFFLL